MPGKTLVESASAIFDTLGGELQMFPPAFPPPLRAYSNNADQL
jgi:hypothetical protein